MYHALVKRNGSWESFGLHVPSNQWSNFFHTLQHLYGKENVSYVFWPPQAEISGTRGIRDRSDLDVETANLAQAEWNRGQLWEAEENGHLNVARGLRILRERSAQPV